MPGRTNTQGLACLAGAWKRWAQEREGRVREVRVGRGSLPCLPLARQFFLAPKCFQAPATQATKGLKITWRMCCLCCAIYKWLDILVFSDKEEKPEAPSHSFFTVLIRVRRERTDTAVRKELGGVYIGGVVQPFIGWVGNERDDIIWEVIPVLSPVTLLSHPGEFQ